MWLAAHCGLACMHAAYGRPPLPGRGGGAKGHFLGLLLALGWHRMPVTPGRRCVLLRGVLCGAELDFGCLRGAVSFCDTAFFYWLSCGTVSFLDTPVTLTRFLTLSCPCSYHLTLLWHWPWRSAVVSVAAWQPFAFVRPSVRLPWAFLPFSPTRNETLFKNTTKMKMF